MTEKYRYITDTGAISADTADIQTSIQNEYKLALGSSMSTAPATAQGTLIAGETISRTDVMKNNAEVANVVNPNLSYGTYLDAICSLLGIGRNKNQSTVATGIEITGDNPTFIAAGSRVRTEDNAVFVTLEDVTIPPGGVTTVSIQSQEYGPVPLPLGLLTIIDGTIGWGSAEVVVGSSVTLGALALLDPALKNKRNQQLAKQGVGSSRAVASALLEVANVTSCMVVENNTGAVGTIHGVTFTKPNALWVCVAGTPSSADVAQALYDVHNAGCPWDFGATGNGVPVGAPNGIAATDPATGLIYNVQYTTPVKYDCYVHIEVKQANSVSSPGPAVQSAIMSYANGQEEGELGLVVGASVSSFEVAGAVSRQLPGLYTKSCMVAVVPAGDPAPAYPADYSLESVMNQFDQAILQTGNISVIVVT